MILVVGATGQLGSRIARQLLTNRKDVRILVRERSNYQPLIEAGAHPIFGDLKEPSSLAPAMEGIDTVISTATSGGRGGEDSIARVDLQGNRDLIDAATQAGVRKFIFTSTIGSEPDSPVELFRAKGSTEAYLRESGLDYTVLQSNGYMDVWIPLVVGLPLQQGAPVGIIGEGSRKHSFIAQRDVTAFAIKAINHPAARNATIVLGGPAAISWQDVLSSLEHLLGRPLQVESYAPGSEIPIVPPFVSHLMTMQQTYDSPIAMDETAGTFGITLTPLEEWLRTEFLPTIAMPAAQSGDQPDRPNTR